MLTLNKEKGKDFTILALTDTHFHDGRCDDSHAYYNMIVHTINELIHRVKPDLLLFCGDQAWGNHHKAFHVLGNLIEGYGIPWTLTWGNHDQDQTPRDFLQRLNACKEFPHLLYENGPEGLRQGNFSLIITEEGKPLSALVMINSGDRKPFVNEKGEESLCWSEIDPDQIEWYKEEIDRLTAMGCADSMVVTHTPPYAFADASAAAFKDEIDKRKLPYEDSLTDTPWKEGFEDAFGVEHETICCYPKDNGFFDTVCALGSTKHIVVGHDHTNCTSIPYRGVRLTYCLRVGLGAYGDPRFNGGTVYTVTENGISVPRHEFVDIMHFVEK